MQGMENVNLKMFFHILYTLMLFQTHIAFLAWNTKVELNTAALFNTKRENED